MAQPKTTTVMVSVAALFLASIAAYLVYNFLVAKKQEAETAKMGVQSIVVTTAEVPFGSKLQPTQIRLASWPKDGLPPGFITDPKAAEGRITIASIPLGAPVTESSLAKTDAGVLTFIVPAGHRAMTVAVNEVVGVAGFILPNSIVDVIATLTPTTGNNTRISKIVLQNIKVLAIGQILEEKEGKPVIVPTVTLDVTPVEAEKLAMASEQRVQLILKHFGDKDEVKTRGETAATLLGGAMPAEPKPAARAAKAAPRPKEAPRAAAKEEPFFVDVIRGNARSREEVK